MSWGLLKKYSIIFRNGMPDFSARNELFTIETLLAITTADFENSVDNLKKSEYNSLEKRRL